jgi:hypothetical protein
MRIYRAVEDENNLPAEDKEKIAILKLVPNGEYIPKVGLRQNEYFILEHTDKDGPELVALLASVSQTNSLRNEGLPQIARSKLFMAYIQTYIERYNDEHP